MSSLKPKLQISQTSVSQNPQEPINYKERGERDKDPTVSRIYQGYNLDQADNGEDYRVKFIEKCLVLLSYLFVILTLPLSLFVVFVVVREFERAVILRNGKLRSSVPYGPGLVHYLPCVDAVKFTDLRIICYAVPPQEALTKDALTVAVDAVVYYKICDPIWAVVNIADYNGYMTCFVQRCRTQMDPSVIFILKVVSNKICDPIWAVVNIADYNGYMTCFVQRCRTQMDPSVIFILKVVSNKICDPIWAVVNIADYKISTQFLAATTLRNTLGTRKLTDILCDRPAVSSQVFRNMKNLTLNWGVKIIGFEVKDISLPSQLQRAMAAEAESYRLANAKIIVAKAEIESTRNLQKATTLLMDNPYGMQLRYLQALQMIAGDKTHTIVMPFSAESLKKLFK